MCYRMSQDVTKFRCHIGCHRMSQNSGVVFHCIIIYFNIFGSDLYSKIHWIMTDPYLCWLNEQNIFRFVPIVLQDMMSHFPQIRKVLVPTSPVPYPWMKLIFTFYFIFYSDYNRNSKWNTTPEFCDILWHPIWHLNFVTSCDIQYDTWVLWHPVTSNKKLWSQGICVN
jgi:hypothetical protein